MGVGDDGWEWARLPLWGNFLSALSCAYSLVGPNNVSLDTQHRAVGSSRRDNLKT